MEAAQRYKYHVLMHLPLALQALMRKYVPLAVVVFVVLLVLWLRAKFYS